MCLLFMHGICYWEVCKYFSIGEGRMNFSTGWILHRGDFGWRGKCPGGEIFRANFKLGEFARILIRNVFMSCFVRVKFLPGLNCAKHIPVERGFSVEVEPNILVAFKKTIGN